LTIVREANARAATGGIDRGAGVDLGIAAAIPVTRAIPSPRSVTKLRLKVLDAPAGSSFSFAPRQRSSGDTLVIARDDPRAIRSFALPEKDGRFAEDLRSTPFFQADDDRVKHAAAKIVGGEHDAERVARRLVDWVYENLEKVPTLSVPNAVQVLAERKGDCNEHAVLFAALARAAGLPARMIAGVVYMPGQDDAPGAFYYHAWNEVWLGEWIAVDPTFDQFPADATHVELIEGGPDKDITLLGLVGRLRVDVEEVG
jgi:transglutaminase-like putative cysteine protease